MYHVSRLPLPTAPIIELGRCRAIFFITSLYARLVLGSEGLLPLLDDMSIISSVIILANQLKRISVELHFASYRRHGKLAKLKNLNRRPPTRPNFTKAKLNTLLNSAQS